jgi:nucleoside-diphosphate-sugar epimerase
LTRSRIVVVGSGGFVGGVIASRAERDGQSVIRINRATVDLCSEDGAGRLAQVLRPEDRIVFAAAEAPCKSHDALTRNLAMALTVIRAVAEVRVSYLLNVSSDAVYLDSPRPLTESSALGPANLHGSMHCAREFLLRTVGLPLLHLRSTLIYGTGDPHNGYGPNQFLALARAGREIALFGHGEEQRDHVHIADVADVAMRCLREQTTGALNVATGEVRSFREIAERIVELFGGRVRVVERPRTGPMPHDGYRPISVDLLRDTFPDFEPVGVLTGLEREVGKNGA